MRYSDSFLLHLRPRFYRPGSLDFSSTFYLGFLCVFLFVLEIVTGVLLMVYYAPTPAEAYGSIIRISTEVPFGSLLRDLHRIGGEIMIVAVVLHMGKVFVKGSYTGKYAITWATGVFLLVSTLLLAFSGYLLPWDQLAYWAVTIGTSMADTIPGFGNTITTMVRGGAEMGQDGLLRFYLLHVIGLPLIMTFLLAVHYFRVVRIHPLQKPSSASPDETATDRNVNFEKIPFIPRVALLEITLSIALLVILVGVAAFFYDAPLEHHANPRHTPSATQAPWFFLWLQGALKLGDSFLMGIIFPTVILLFLLFLPYLPRAGRRSDLLPRIPWLVLALAFICLSALTYMGLPRHGISQGPIHEFFQEFMPEEGTSIFHETSYTGLPQGIYEFLPDRRPAGENEQMSHLMQSLSRRISALAAEQSVKELQGILIIEEWQSNLKRVRLRLTWSDEAGPVRYQSEEKELYLYRRGSEPETPAGS